MPLGLGNAHDQQAAAGATLYLPRPKTGGAPPCAEHCDGADDDEHGALWASGLPLTVPGPPKLCRNAATCGLQCYSQNAVRSTAAALASGRTHLSIAATAATMRRSSWHRQQRLGARALLASLARSLWQWGRPRRPCLECRQWALLRRRSRTTDLVTIRCPARLLTHAVSRRARAHETRSTCGGGEPGARRARRSDERRRGRRT